MPSFRSSPQMGRGWVFGPPVRFCGFRLRAAGCLPVKIGDVALGARGASWGVDGSIILGGFNIGLRSIDAESGELTELTQPDREKGEEYHAWPDLLPDGKHVLFTLVTGESSDIGVLSLETREWQQLEGTQGGAQPHYVSSGHVVFSRCGALFAARFDPARRVLIGRPVQVGSDVLAGNQAGLDLGYYTLSRSENLAFVPKVGSGTSRAVLVDRRGVASDLLIETGLRYGISLSPDGERLAFAKKSDRGSDAFDIWVHDLRRGTPPV